jgi:drug/metabolite transporter (DMT)-like permease
MSDIFGAPQSFVRLGEVLSVGAAVFWAIAIILFRIAGEKVHPLGVNLFKNVLALALLFPSILLSGQRFGADLSAAQTAWLFLSGVVGIAVADTLFLDALNRLGAELMAIVDCSYSPFVIVLSVLFIGERMTGLQTLGVGLILAAVLMITLRPSAARLPRQALLAGVGIGVVAIFLQAAGIVMFKPLIDRTTILWMALARMTGGAAGTALAVAFHRERGRILRSLRSASNWPALVPAALLGSYISNVIWLGGMKYIQASIASALNQLNTIFVFILAAVFLRERVTPIKAVAVAVAFAGALLASAAL